MASFVGREKELNLIGAELQKTSAAIMVYGKRKVGKTTLIMEALKSSSDKTVYYECLKSTMRDNVSGFVKVLNDAGVMQVKLPFESFIDVFAYLGTLNVKLNIVIDEYPYLKEMTKPETVDSIFQAIVDNHLAGVRLFLSGSHIGMMKDMLKEKNALYGRFSLVLRLAELNYREAASFYENKSAYDKIAFYSVFGGSPFALGFVDKEKDLRENVIRTVLNVNSPVYNYAEHLLISDYSSSIGAERILCAVSNGKKKYCEIEEMLDMKNNGLLSKQMTSLLKMEILVKRFPINKPEDKKKTSYELSDNLLRFYYTFIYKNKSALAVLGAEAFYDEYIAGPIVTLISHRFEEVCRSYFSLRAQNRALPGVTNIGTFWYDDPAEHKNGEFDVVLARKNAFDVYEVKYYTHPLSEKEVEKEALKIRQIRGLPLGKIGFISVSGFETVNPKYDRIDGEKLYAPFSVDS